MYQNWQALAAQNRAESVQFNPLQYLDPNNFRLGDYFACFWRGACFGILLNAPIIMLGIFSPALLVAFLPCIVGAACLLGIVIAAVAHSFKTGFKDRVDGCGINFVLDYEDLNLPMSQAFELCLASTMQVRGALIVRSIEGQKICARVKAVPDRTIIISLIPLRNGITRAAIDCVMHWKPWRARLMRQLFGAKFEPLALRMDDGLNGALISEFVTCLRETPNWDYKYEGFKPKSVAAALR